MRRWIVTAGVLLGVAFSSSATAGTETPQFGEGSFRSRAVNGTLHFAIALPPGYATSGLRYPVVYVLHGLPAPATAYRSIRGFADSLATAGRSAIVVGAQGTRKGDPDPEWHNWGRGRNWETATERELVSWIDGHYRTIAQRSGRAIVGISAGGYGAMLISIHHPETYQVTESWSGYFFPTNPSGKPLDLGTPNANVDANAHFAIRTLKQRFGRYPSDFFGFFIGNKDPYPGFVADNRRLDRELTQAGVKHRFRIYEGAHDHAFWTKHQDEWLAAAVDRLDRPR